ncbi:MAG TPA: FHA domain-containing protein [bacterium]|nr:FHA domain-containing protein [bacterium]
MYNLEVIDSRNRTIVYPLKVGTVSVGRQSDNDIVINEKSVSRSHCLLYVRENYLEVEDLGSANGVIVGGKLISKRTEFKLNDELIIGEVRLAVREAGRDDEMQTTFMEMPEK